MGSNIPKVTGSIECSTGAQLLSIDGNDEIYDELKMSVEDDRSSRLVTDVMDLKKEPSDLFGI
jgi:hypothetical protein